MWQRGGNSSGRRKPHKTKGLPCLIGGLIITLLFGPVTAFAETEFLAFGDIPYSNSDQYAVVEEIGRQARAAGLPFAVNYGDIKGGGERCGNALLARRVALMASVIPGKVIATPGDNDWTDCDRNSAGGYDELERLDYLLDLLHEAAPDEGALGITRQVPAYWENARWQQGETLFTTLHVVGTDNGRQQIDKSDRDAALDRVSARDAANLVWLEQSFVEARKSGAEALVFVTHHDPTSFKYSDDEERKEKHCTFERRRKCNPYKLLVDRMKALTAAIGVPVLWVHGSTGPVCLDKGFGGSDAPGLWRLNGPGDFAVLDAAVVTVNPSAQIPFRARLLLAGSEIETGC